MFPTKAILSILAIFVLISSVSATPLQNGQDGKFFPETGHWVSGPFLELYNQSPEPLLVYGYPITEPFDSPFVPGETVQYFQRARFNLDPTSPNAHAQVADLGMLLYDSAQPGQKTNFSNTTGACRQFPNKKYVCYTFLQFYEAHNGPVAFGDPVADAEYLNGRLVQYFTKSRMEWRPEMPLGQHVALSDLGKIEFDLKIRDPRLLTPNYQNAPLPIQQSLIVRAFPASPLIPVGSKQKIFVIVRDQYLEPKEGASVKVTINTPGHPSENARTAQSTNTDGVTQVEIDLPDVKPNQVIEVQVTAYVNGGLVGTAQTWFRTWW